MQTETITSTLYQFDELSDSAKETARDWWRDTYDYPWDADNRATLDAFCSAFPVEAKDWQYDAWSADITSRFTGEDETGQLFGNRLRTYLVNNYSKWLRKPKTYCKGNQYVSGAKVRKSRITKVGTDCPFTGYCLDYDILHPIRDFIVKPDSRDFEELLSDCLWSWVYACRDVAAGEMEDESVDENIRINEYEFDEYGNLA